MSPDGLEVRVDFRAGPYDRYVGELHIGNEQVASARLGLVVDLGAFEGQRGRIVVKCLPGRENDPRGDWTAILNFAVAPTDTLDLAIGRAQATWRAANERARFEGVYDHGIYQDGLHAGVAGRTLEVETIDGVRRRASGVTAAQFAPTLRDIAPLEGERAFRFANRLLDTLLPAQVQFARRLEAIGARLGRRVRLLSLCAGEARIEAAMLAETGVPPDVTLVDIAPALLLTAGARFPATARVRLVQAAVEDFGAGEESYDIVLFVSGMHHIVELEAVSASVAQALSDDGEFWLVGEQVGPNGNRLWPEAARVAAPLFADLPERLRFNLNTGRSDAQLPDLDFGSSSFAGIHSQDIPRALARHFMPVAEDRRHCFLWRLIDAAYEANYSLGNAEDVEILRGLVAEEYAYFANGGIGCELNGVYRSKLSR